MTKSFLNCNFVQKTKKQKQNISSDMIGQQTPTDTGMANPVSSVALHGMILYCVLPLLHMYQYVQYTINVCICMNLEKEWAACHKYKGDTIPVNPKIGGRV